MEVAATYAVLEKAREITNVDDLAIIENRRFLGVPLASDILHRWLPQQPKWKPVSLDFTGVRAVTLSVAQELGPGLLQSMQQLPVLEQRYPVLGLHHPEHAYTFADALSDANWACLAVVESTLDPSASAFQVSTFGHEWVVVLGQLTDGMRTILELADRRAEAGEFLTSDDLASLDFLANVSAGARSKRLTELHARRLLAFRENPRNPKERLFTPTWRL